MNLLAPSRPLVAIRRLPLASALGKQLGAEKIGASLYELGDGERGFPYHFHHGMEEWLIVARGNADAPRPDGERELRRGDVVCFPRGPEGAHQVAARARC